MISNKEMQGEAKIVNITLIKCTVCPDNSLSNHSSCLRFNLYLLTGRKGYTDC